MLLVCSKRAHVPAQCAIIVADYKLNFTQEKSAQIEDLHARVAQRLFDLFTGNG